MRAVCQICQEAYAIVEIDGYAEQDPNTGRIVTIKPLRYPMSGDMFGSPDRTHGYPDPFDPSLTWEHFMCPYGRIHRPMVKDDIVLTHKGLLRLPKDGGMPYIDKDDTGEIDRHSISDRTMQIPDDVAEKMAREILQGGPKVVTSDEVPKDAVVFMDKSHITVIKGDPIPPLHVYEVKVDPDKSEWICAICAKRFETKRAYDGHMGGAHKPPKVISRSHPIPKRKRA